MFYSEDRGIRLNELDGVFILAASGRTIISSFMRIYAAYLSTRPTKYLRSDSRHTPASGGQALLFASPSRGLLRGKRQRCPKCPPPTGYVRQRLAAKCLKAVYS